MRQIISLRRKCVPLCSVVFVVKTADSLYRPNRCGDLGGTRVSFRRVAEKELAVQVAMEHPDSGVNQQQQVPGALRNDPFLLELIECSFVISK